MGTTDLRGDSMNYAAISKNVLFGQDPLILSLNGDLYMNKPPLFFWVNALFIKLFGATPFSVKVSTLLAVLLIAYFLYKIAMEIYNDNNIAVMLPVLFFSTYIVYKNTHMLKLEAFVTAFMIGSVYFFVKYIRDQKFAYVLLMGCCVGLAIFSKGPLGIVPLLGMAVYPLINRSIFSGKYYLHFLIILIVALAIPGWWFGYVMAKTPFYETFFLGQMLDRVANNSISVTGATYFERPIWAYLLYILKYGGLFLIFFPYGLYRLKKDEKMTDQLKYILLTGLIYTVIIHFITTREQRYLYQFYLFFWIIGAYGLGCLLKKNFTTFVQYAGLAVMFFIVVYPGKLNWSTYGVLQEAAKMAKESNVPVVVRDAYVTGVSDKAAVDFYIENPLKEPPKDGGWIEVVNKKNKLEQGVELFKTRRIIVYVMPDEAN